MKSIKVIREGKMYKIPELWVTARMLAWSTLGLEAYEAAITLWIEQEKLTERLKVKI